MLTAAGVVVFTLLSRALTGTGEVIVQSAIVLGGGLVASFLPAHLVQPRNVDGIAWASLLGLVGSLFFTVIDTVLLRPLDLYHWTWDAIGGGSGFWYIPVWWMGAAALAWLGAWIVAIRAGGSQVNTVVSPAAVTGVLALALFGRARARAPRRTGGRPHPAVSGRAPGWGIRGLAWLLTPAVVWAASFMGGWLGAVLGARVAGASSGVLWMFGGAVVFGSAALIAWALRLRRGARLARRGLSTPASPGDDVG
jgi:hypothetical protein